MIWDLAPHDISIVSFILDELPASTAVWAHKNISAQHYDVAYLRMDFPESQTRAYVHVSWLTPNKVRQFTVVGNARWRSTTTCPTTSASASTTSAWTCRPSTTRATHALPVTYRTGDITSPFIAFEEPLVVQDQHFLDCLRTGPDRAVRERGLDIVRILASTDDALAEQTRTFMAQHGKLADLVSIRPGATTGPGS